MRPAEDISERMFPTFPTTQKSELAAPYMRAKIDYVRSRQALHIFYLNLTWRWSLTSILRLQWRDIPLSS